MKYLDMTDQQVLEHRIEALRNMWDRGEITSEYMESEIAFCRSELVDIRNRCDDCGEVLQTGPCRKCHPVMEFCQKCSGATNHHAARVRYVCRCTSR